MYAITIALNHQEISNRPERISKFTHFIPKYNWDGIDFPAGRKEWKIFEKNCLDIAFNILSVPYNKEEIKIQYKSKYNRTRKNQITLLQITDNKNILHYLALKSIAKDNGYMKTTKSISKFFRGISSKHDDDFYCLGCLHSYRSNKSLKKHETLCNNNDYCKVTMSDDDNKILKHQFGTKSLKMSHVIYVDTESLLIKHDSCSNIPETFYRETKATYVACR